MDLGLRGRVRVRVLDLTDDAGPARLVQLAGDRIDILVNNVGSAPARTGGFLGVTDEQWLASIMLNLMVAVRTTRHALPVMLAEGRGSIVNVCSVNSRLADPAVTRSVLVRSRRRCGWVPADSPLRWPVRPGWRPTRSWTGPRTRR